jgi:hypothetical protein
MSWNEIAMRIKVVWYPHEPHHGGLHYRIIWLRGVCALIRSHRLKRRSRVGCASATTLIIECRVVLLTKVGDL